MGEIKIAISGIGNCCSSLIQGLYYYRKIDSNDEAVPGLMHNVLGGYKISDVRPVAAFDVDKRKVGKDLSEAIFERPNNTLRFQKDVPKIDVRVQMGHVLDGVAPHMMNYPEDESFRVADEKPVDVVKVLRDSGAEILVNYLPVGSQKAVEFYANCALEAGVGFVNCMPVFIASNHVWAKKFEEKKLPCVGDDVKSQVGATITHRVLTKLWADRGVKVDKTYQLNFGGNTDFLNMLERSRLVSKKLSKTESVQSQLPVRLPDRDIHIGPSDYVPWQKDKKVCYIRMEGRKFGDVPVTMEVRLDVEDSPNSAGVAIDAIRCCKIGLDRNIAGPLKSISSYTMKHPIEQYSDSEARERVEDFIAGMRER